MESALLELQEAMEEVHRHRALGPLLLILHRELDLLAQHEPKAGQTMDPINIQLANVQKEIREVDARIQKKREYLKDLEKEEAVLTEECGKLEEVLSQYHTTMDSYTKELNTVRSDARRITEESAQMLLELEELEEEVGRVCEVGRDALRVSALEQEKASLIAANMILAEQLWRSGDALPL